MFFQQTIACSLSEETIQRLNAQLEGWATGLRFLTLTLQGRTPPSDVEQYLVLLANAHRPILDYFITEVLSAQEEPFQRFLLQTSVLRYLNDSLCDAITDRQDSSLLLEKAERAGLFLQRLNEPGQWYRYHELFAEALRHEAWHRLGEEALHALSLRACHWYETHDLLHEAVETALAIHEYTYAASLIEHYPIAKLFAGWHHTLHHWLAQLPEEILWTNPTLCFMYAMAYLFIKDRYAPETRTFLEVLLQKAEQNWRAVDDQPKLGTVWTLRSLIAWWQDDYAASFAAARQALALLPAQDIMWRGISLMHASMEEQFAGRFTAARQTMAKARSLCAGNIYLRNAALLALGNLCCEQGALQQAEHYYHQALRETEKNENTLDDQGFALLGLAQLAYERNDLASARQKVSQALANGRQLNNASLQASSTLALARILHALGEDEQAQQLLQELMTQIQKPRLLQELLLGQARLALACGDLATAQRWMPASIHDGTLVPFAQREQEMLFKARLLLAQGACHQALTLLNDWQREEFSSSELENLALSALAHAQISSPEQSAAAQANVPNHQFRARQFLLRALELAQPEAFQRLFLDEGEKMATLLRSILPQIRDAALYAYASNLTLAFFEPNMMPGSLVPASNPLSVQKQRVLRLLAAGRTKPVMAQELIVSLNTIKTHVKSIYHKLGASSSQEALARARTLRLL